MYETALPFALALSAVTGVDLEEVSVKAANGPSSVNIHNNNGNYPRSTPTLEQRVERLERATFGDDQIGLYGVIRQQRAQTRWLQLLTGVVFLAEIVRFWVG